MSVVRRKSSPLQCRPILRLSRQRTHTHDDLRRVGLLSLLLLSFSDPRRCSLAAAWCRYETIGRRRPPHLVSSRTKLIRTRLIDYQALDGGDSLHKSSASLQFAASILSNLNVRKNQSNLDDGAVASSDMARDEMMARLQQENEMLKAKLRNMESENQLLHREVTNRIVLETFEGEGKLRRFSAPTPQHFATVTSADNALSPATVMGNEAALSSAAATQSNSMWLDPSSEASMWCDELDDNNTCPVEPMVSFVEALRDRAVWLVGLLVLQSGSGLILARNEELLAHHPFSKLPCETLARE
jgi:hypothetical protein